LKRLSEKAKKDTDNYMNQLQMLFLFLTTVLTIWLNWKQGTTLVPYMTVMYNRKNINEVRIKFVAPEDLKGALQTLANERNITLSALLRLITSEYVRRNQQS